MRSSESTLRKITSLPGGRSVLLSAVMFLIFTSLVLPWQARVAETRTGSQSSPDTSLIYSSQSLYQTAEEYGEEGRQAYIRARWTFDVIWPLVYVFFLFTGISWFSRQFPKPAVFWQYAALTPLLSGLADYLENTMTSLVMAFYPQTFDLAAGLAPIFTLLKWVSITASFVLYLLTLAKFLLAKLRK